MERRDADDWVSGCINLKVGGVRGRGRGRKTWKECVADDMRKLNLKRIVHFGGLPFWEIVQPVRARINDGR